MQQIYEDKLKTWIDVDNKLLSLKEEMSKLNIEKKDIEDDILKYVEESDLTGVSIKVSDGIIKFPKRKVQQSITMKYIQSKLKQYSEQNNNIIDVENVCKFLMSHLEIKQKTYIKRDYKG